MRLPAWPCLRSVLPQPLSAACNPNPCCWLAGRAVVCRQAAEERHAASIAALKAGWAAELKRQHAAWQAGVTTQQEAWRAAKVAEIKEQTVKVCVGAHDVLCCAACIVIECVRACACARAHARNVAHCSVDGALAAVPD